MLTIKYYERGTNKEVVLHIDPVSDVVEVQIPRQSGQPKLSVNVSTDAVVIDRIGAKGKRDHISTHEYSDDLAGFASYR